MTQAPQYNSGRMSDLSQMETREIYRLYCAPCGCGHRTNHLAISNYELCDYCYERVKTTSSHSPLSAHVKLGMELEYWRKLPKAHPLALIHDTRPALDNGRNVWASRNP